MDSARTRRRKREQERDEAKLQYMAMTKRLKIVEKEDDLKTKLLSIKDNIETGDELYKKVSKNLDASAADAKFIRDTVKFAKKTSKLISEKAKQFDLKNVIKLNKRILDDERGNKSTMTQFCRYITEEYSTSVLCIAPTFEFFYGAIRSENLIHEKKQRKEREKLVEKKAITAQERDVEVDVEQDSTPKEVDYINTQVTNLARKSKREDSGISFFKTFVDPKSFTQTVENIFHASFLIKEGQIGVMKGDKDEALLTVNGETNPETSNSIQNKEATKKNVQSIISFSMKDYRNWISTFGIRKRAFPPRQSGEENDNVS